MKKATVLFVDAAISREYGARIVLDPAAQIDVIEYRAIANFLPTLWSAKLDHDNYVEACFRQAIELARRLGVELVVDRSIRKVVDDPIDGFTHEDLQRAYSRGTKF